MPDQPAFPEPAATLPGEADILTAVVADPADDTAKLVYADWLEDRADPRGPLLRECVTAFRAGKTLPSHTRAPKPWRDLVGVSLMSWIVAAELTKLADPILRLARPAVTFKSTRAAEAKLDVGASKFGGGPDMPRETKWPMFRDEPLAFLAQFNFADLSASLTCRELPNAGVLSVFYAAEGEVFDNADRGGWRVFHFPDVKDLARRHAPETQFKPCRLTFTETLTVPERDSPWEKDLGFGDDEGAEVRYREGVIAGMDSAGGLGHRLLGYPCVLQNDVLARKTNRHLLTIDSDDKPGWMWGDAGLLYFTISNQNLKARRFDRVRFEMQCC
jgi:uncharacterized protein (TIGR02996 family)